MHHLIRYITVIDIVEVDPTTQVRILHDLFAFQVSLIPLGKV